MEQAVDKRVRILDPLEVSCLMRFEFFIGLFKALSKRIHSTL